MHESQTMVGNNTGTRGAQGLARGVDVKLSAMHNASLHAPLNASLRVPLDSALETASQERRRTVVALISASIICLVVWGLVVALNIH